LMRFSTRAIHIGEEPGKSTGAVVVPIYQVSTFRQSQPGIEGEYVYARTGNPTRLALETNLAALEEGQYGLAFASGMAAESTILLSLLQKGDHVVAVEDLYGGTRRLFDRVMRNFGVDVSYTEGTNLEALEATFTPETRMLWIESPTNPLLKVIDIKGCAKIAHGHGALLVVDNTFMSPYLQQPLKLGADLVTHSTTKYLGGHSDLLGGAVILNDAKHHEKLRFTQNAVGGVPGPFDSWLVLRGVKTLAVRMDRHCSNAEKVAQFLEENKKIRKVLYPGLASHPQHELARRQMNGFGGMVSFYLNGNFESCKKLLSHLKIFALAESLGGVESLIEHPASMTHASVPREMREKIGVTDSLIRVSVGTEDYEDLIADLSEALDAV
jgi:cystathionine gamma-lyase